MLNIKTIQMNSRKIFGIAFVFVAMLTSCKKEGCIDVNATNYNSEAGKDDGSCVYESTLTFWYEMDVADFLVNDLGTANVSVFVDGAQVATHSSDTYWTAQPTCDDAGAFSFTYDLGVNSSETVSYEVKSDGGTTIWSSSSTLNANTCHVQKLTI